MSAKESPAETLILPVLLSPWPSILAMRLRLAGEKLSHSARAMRCPLKKRLRSAKERSLAWAAQTELRAPLALATAIEQESAFLSFSWSMFCGAFAEWVWVSAWA